jgi:hypothetical protein
MGAVASPPAERRGARRVPPAGMGWRREALLRPGQPVVLVNISAAGALVECASRLRPGALTELQLAGAARRRSVRGRIDRCQVAMLNPLRYHGAIVFEDALERGDASTPAE